MRDHDDTALSSPSTASALRHEAEHSAVPAGLSVEVKSSRRGHSVIVTRGSAWPKNPNGALHGGIVTAAVTNCATITTNATGEGAPVGATALSVAFQRPAVPPLTLETHVHGTGSFATVTAKAEDGRICASAQVTLAPLESHPDGHADGSPLSAETAREPGPTAHFTPAPVDGDGRAWQSWAEKLPVSRAIGLRCLALSPTHATVLMETDRHSPEPSGPVAHAVVAAWADHCFGLVATAAVRPGASPATAMLSSQFLARATAPLTFHATVEKSGRTLVFVNVDVRDAGDELVAIVKGTMSVDGTSRFLPPTH